MLFTCLKTSLCSISDCFNYFLLILIGKLLLVLLLLLFATAGGASAEKNALLTFSCGSKPLKLRCAFTRSVCVTVFFISLISFVPLKFFETMGQHEKRIHLHDNMILTRIEKKIVAGTFRTVTSIQISLYMLEIGGWQDSCWC